jgi:hypothetical protein
MVRVAGGEGTPWTVDTLIQAMTHDLNAYDLERETLATTFYQDATNNDDNNHKEHEESVKANDETNHNNNKNHQDMDDEEEVDEENHHYYDSKMPSQDHNNGHQPPKQHGLGALQRSFTASSLDLTAETYGNKVWVGLCWVSAVLMFFAL